MIASMTLRSSVVLGRPIFLRGGMNGAINALSLSKTSSTQNYKGFTRILG